MTLSPVGSQLAIVDGQQRYRREAQHTKNNSTDLPREGRGRWQEREKEKERKGVEGQLVPEEGQNRAYKYTWRTMYMVRGTECLYEKGKRATRRDATDAFHECMPCVYMCVYSTSLWVVRLPHENKTDTRVGWTTDVAVLHLR